MFVTVLFFAQARDLADTTSETLDLPDGSRVAEALAMLETAHPRLAPLWPHLAVAVNGALAHGETRLEPGAEMALLPPVSGG